MTISSRDKRELIKCGFTKREIEELNNATAPDGKPQPPIDFSSPTWLSALSRRRNFSDRVRAEYALTHHKWLTRRVYNQIVDQWYERSNRRSPWSWLKLAYLPKKKTDFQKAAKRRAQAQTYSLRKAFRRRR